jgi:hypothetical protein
MDEETARGSIEQNSNVQCKRDLKSVEQLRYWRGKKIFEEADIRRHSLSLAVPVTNGVKRG